MRRHKSERRRIPSSAAVLGSDDLVSLILIRLGAPTNLARAALVCRHWYRVASDPDFLRRFRQLVRPGVLGFYGDLAFSMRPQFVPLAEAPDPELAAAIRRASALDEAKFHIEDGRNGRLLVSYLDENETGTIVLSPLHLTRGAAAVIPSPTLPLGEMSGFPYWYFLPEDGSEYSAMVVGVLLRGTTFKANMSTFQSGIWTVSTTVDIQLPQALRSVRNVLPPVHGKIYMSTPGCILEWDLEAASVSVIQLPDRVNMVDFKISCGEHSGLSLVHADGSLLSIWRHRMSGDGAHDWVLVDDAIRVHEAYNRREDVTVFAVDRNLEYVFLGLNTTDVLVSMHLKSRTEKVHGKVRCARLCMENRVIPFMMFWPPIILPALREENMSSDG